MTLTYKRQHTSSYMSHELHSPLPHMPNQHITRTTNALNEEGFSLADGKYEVTKPGHDTAADVIRTATATGKHQATTGMSPTCQEENKCTK